MFANSPYYHATIRNVVVAVGQLFSGITLVNRDGTTREQALRVPISYGPKNKWLERLKTQPNLDSQVVETTLPRLSFEFTDYKYDAIRKIGTQGNSVAGTMGASGIKLFNPVPYDITVQLYSITKDQDDSLKILEQILPYFAPSLNINILVLPQLGIRKDIPLVLDAVSVVDTYEGDRDTYRTVVQNFTFTAKVDLFGPVKKMSSKVEQVEIGISQFADIPPLESLRFV
jgi:hypothetical protein